MKKILLIIALTTSFCISSQQINPQREITQYIHNVFGATEGIKDVLDIVQDPAGYLWMATYEGLKRYDGNEFKLYSSATRSDLDLSSVRSLCLDREGRLWVGSNDNGVSLYQNNRFTTFTTKHGLPNNSIRKLYCDSMGNIWAGTASGVALFNDNEFKTFSEFDDLNMSQTLFISDGPDNAVFIGTNRSGGVYRYKNGSVELYRDIAELRDSKLEYMTYDNSDKNLWAITLNTLYRVEDGVVKESYNVDNLVSETISLQELYFDKKNTLWIIADGGLVRFSKGKFSFYFNENGLSDNLVKSVFQDYEGTLWVGTNKGLDKFREPKFTIYNTDQGVVNNGINAFIEDEERIWVGTNQGISIYDKNSGSFIENSSVNSINERIRHLYKDSSGTIWISTYGHGVLKYRNGKIIEKYDSKSGLAGNKVRVVFQDSRGAIYVGTTTGFSVINNGSIKSYNLLNGMAFEYVMCFGEDRSGTILIGTDGGGVLKFRDGIFTGRVNREDGLLSDIIFRFYMDSNNRTWVSTSGGISIISESGISNYTVKNGLLDNAVFQIIKGDNDVLWMTTSSGLFSVKESSFYSGGKNRIDITVYDSLSGLNGGVTATSWGFIDKDKNLWLPTYNGVALLDKNSSGINSTPPKVEIDSEIYLDNLSYPRDRIKKFSPGTKRVGFQFSALSFQIPQKVQVQYKLSGFDYGWSPLSTSKREAIYTNLPAGNYTFMVRAVNNDGVSSLNNSTYHFEKLPHFYETLIFRVAVVLLCIGALILTLMLGNFIRIRVLTAQLKSEREAKRAIEELTNSYSRFVPHEYLSLMDKSNIRNLKLGDQKETSMAILVTDIRNFTSTMEVLTSQESFNLLNRYLSVMVPVIKSNNGLIDKYIGDCIMGLFPGDTLKAVESALNAALELQDSVKEFNRELEAAGKESISIGIGLHYGSLMLGTIGEEERMDVTVISDSVNTAFRLESLTKDYNCGLIVSSSIKNNVTKNSCKFIFLGDVTVKGKNRSVEIYKVTR